MRGCVVRGEGCEGESAEAELEDGLGGVAAEELYGAVVVAHDLAGDAEADA